MNYLIVGIASVNENRIANLLPWALKRWSLPQPIELDRGLIDWYIDGLYITSETKESSNSKSGPRMPVVEILDAIPNADIEGLLNLEIAFWIDFYILHEFNATLLRTYSIDQSKYCDII